MTERQQKSDMKVVLFLCKNLGVRRKYFYEFKLLLKKQFENRKRKKCFIEETKIFGMLIKNYFITKIVNVM